MSDEETYPEVNGVRFVPAPDPIACYEQWARVNGNLYIHPDDLPKPKDRFEEMAEKAIVVYGNHVVLEHKDVLSVGFAPQVDAAPKAAERVREWFIAHARKIDADATERCIEKLRAIRVGHSITYANLYAKVIDDCIAELSKP